MFDCCRCFVAPIVTVNFGIVTVNCDCVKIIVIVNHGIVTANHGIVTVSCDCVKNIVTVNHGIVIYYDCDCEP